MFETPSYEAVGKIVSVITCFVDEAPEWGVRELANRIGQSKSTVHRILTALTTLNWLTYDEGIRKYKVGFELFRVTTLLSHAAMPLVPVVRPYLEAIGERTGEAVIFCYYDEKSQKMIFLDMVESTHPLRYAINLGVKNELYAGATGRSILAYLPSEIQTFLVQSVKGAITENTVIDPTKLVQKLEETRAVGYAVSHGERIPGAVSVAAPFWSGTSVLGSIALTVPEQRIESSETIMEWGRLLVEETDKLSRNLSSNQREGRARL